MNTSVEKSLQRYPVVDYATVKTILAQSGYKYINDKIKYMKKQGLLIPLKRGLYIYRSPYVETYVSKEIIANNLLGPSYISFEYALSYYGLIPERVEEVTSATTKRAKSFSTPYGVFSYRHIDPALFALGVRIESSRRGNFMIATKEKALCDQIMITRGVKIASKRAMRILLEKDLRIDMDELPGFDLEIVKRYADISKSKRAEFLHRVLEDMVE